MMSEARYCFSESPLVFEASAKKFSRALRMLAKSVETHNIDHILSMNVTYDRDEREWVVTLIGDGLGI